MMWAVRLIDLSHKIFDGLVTYKGLPAPIICDYLSREDSRSHYDPGTEFQIAHINMVANTGTYMDCPFHRYEDGRDLTDTHLEDFVDLPVVLIEATGQMAIGPQYFADHDLKSKAVLVHTGWSRHWNSDQYFENHPFITEAGAEFLKAGGAALVGIDSFNIDDTRSAQRPCHSILLGADILIVEHMTHLNQVPVDKPCLFTAAPPKFEGVGTFPVRAFVKVLDN